MNICVYGSADVPSEKCLQAANALGSYIGKNGHTLVFGGFGDGLLGAVADEAYKNGAKVIRNSLILIEFSETVTKEQERNYRRTMPTPLLLCRRAWVCWMNFLKSSS